jgi:hypothetical protein
MLRGTVSRLASAVAILSIVGCGAAASTPAGPIAAERSPEPEVISSSSEAVDATEAPPPPPASSPASTTGIVPTDLVFPLMMDVIRASRPDATFELREDQLDGTWSLDGDVIDATGRGRLYVVITPRPGDLTAHPCADPDFRQGGPCAERIQPDGSRLAIRDRVTGGDVTTVIAVVIHRDRSGLTAEASDASINGPLEALTDGDRPALTRTRAAPPYTAPELAGLVLEMDRRLRESGLP